MRRFILSALMVAGGIATPSLAQVDPNQPPNLFQQVQENMNNAGVTGQDIAQQVRQQLQDGTFDPQAFGQQLQRQGIIDQGMIDQFQQARNQMQQQMQQRSQQQQMTSMQRLLNSPDDEWAVLSAKIQRILDLNADLGQAGTPVVQPRSNRVGGIGGAQTQPQTAAVGPVGKALAELKALLQDPNSSEVDVSAKLSAYRQARQRVQADLASARSDLLALVTLRQEAILLNMDVLY